MPLHAVAQAAVGQAGTAGIPPDKFESVLECCWHRGLGAGIRFIQKKGVASIWEHEKRLKKLLREGLSVIRGVKVYGPSSPDESVGIVSFTVMEKTVSEIGQRLDEEYGIMTR